MRALDFYEGCVEALLFAEGPDVVEGEDLSYKEMGYTKDSLTPHAKQILQRACQRFLNGAMYNRLATKDLLQGVDMKQAGRDFWYTVCHHGTGFWDKQETYKEWETLTRIAHSIGTMRTELVDKIDHKIDVWCE